MSKNSSDWNESCPVPLKCKQSLTKKSFKFMSKTLNKVFPEKLTKLIFIHRSDYSESEMEQLGIYSLGKSLQACHCLHPGGVLTDLVGKMTSAIDTVSLLHVLECVDNQWKILVGSSPISRFVAQLCKLTLGWTMTSIPASCGLSQTSTCRPALAAETNHHEISHIEFSRLNDSSSSSGSTSPNLPRPPRLPVCSSPILYNNNHIEQVPKLPPKPGQTGGTKRKLPQRNPSRLYRIGKQNSQKNR